MLRSIRVQFARTRSCTPGWRPFTFLFFLVPPNLIRNNANIVARKCGHVWFPGFSRGWPEKEMFLFARTTVHMRARTHSPLGNDQTFSGGKPKKKIIISIVIEFSKDARNKKKEKKKKNDRNASNFLRRNSCGRWKTVGVTTIWRFVKTSIRGDRDTRGEPHGWTFFCWRVKWDFDFEYQIKCVFAYWFSRTVFIYLFCF